VRARKRRPSSSSAAPANAGRRGRQRADAGRWGRPPPLPPRPGTRRACSTTKGLFIMNSACCGTVVVKRPGLLASGLVEIESAEQPGQVLAVNEPVHVRRPENGAPGCPRLTTGREVECARRGQQASRQRLEIEPAPGEVDGASGSRRRGGRQSVGH